MHQVRHCSLLGLIALVGGAAPATGLSGTQALHTNLAQLTITPIRPSGHGTAASGWQTIYDFSGQTPPPGTRVFAYSKWGNPRMVRTARGIVFRFPHLAAHPPSASQTINSGFEVERAISNYPTKVSFAWQSYFNQMPGVPYAWWSPFTINRGDDEFTPIVGSAPGLTPVAARRSFFHAVGTNHVVLRFGGRAKPVLTINGRRAGAFFRPPLRLPKAGAMLLPGIGISNRLLQLPPDQGKWYAIRSFRIQQWRPPLAQSAVACLHLKVPGRRSVRVTIDVVNPHNASVGYVLRDAVVAPGSYVLYWDGVESRQSQPASSTGISAGLYTFRMTTSRVRVSYAGQVNNTTPANSPGMYGLVSCTAMALTPPGTPPPPASRAYNNHVFTVQPRTTNSIQLGGVGYDANMGQWIGPHGTCIYNRAGDWRMQYASGLAITPPSPDHPKNPNYQYYFASKFWSVGTSAPLSSIVSCSFPHGPYPTHSRHFTSPDWNRPNRFWHYRIALGRLPQLRGRCRYLYFKCTPAGRSGAKRRNEWIFRNLRLYQQGAKTSTPVVFRRSLFTRRRWVHAPPQAIRPGTLRIGDHGRSVHLINARSLNYPL
ncbi:MAG: hypothetical protein HKL95_08215, partial [Phycisphaerae bacterium]|nr:hypothetical protein [Phycisphaerae bacterium]